MTKLEVLCPKCEGAVGQEIPCPFCYGRRFMPTREGMRLLTFLARYSFADIERAAFLGITAEDVTDEADEREAEGYDELVREQEATYRGMV